jgi:hypothetical protein
MKIFVLGSTLAISVLLTVPAGARGGYPIIGPSYPYPSYCQQCVVGWQASPQPRVIVRRHRERHRTGTNAAANQPEAGH